MKKIKIKKDNESTSTLSRVKSRPLFKEADSTDYHIFNQGDRIYLSLNQITKSLFFNIIYFQYNTFVFSLFAPNSVHVTLQCN